jgi:DNA-binding NarL/FixJ family response regulator
LTQQQYRILMMFAQGLLNKQIAYDLMLRFLDISHSTSLPTSSSSDG